MNARLKKLFEASSALSFECYAVEAGLICDAAKIPHDSPDAAEKLGELASVHEVIRKMRKFHVEIVSSAFDELTCAEARALHEAKEIN